MKMIKGQGMEKCIGMTAVTTRGSGGEDNKKGKEPSIYPSKASKKESSIKTNLFSSTKI